MTAPEIAVIGGIDTHTDVHQAAVIDSIGRHLDTQPFETNSAGYEQLLAWLRAQGDVIAVGMEGTGGLRRRTRPVPHRQRHHGRRGRPPGPKGQAGPRQVRSDRRLRGGHRRPVRSRERNTQEPERDRGSDPRSACGPQERRQGTDADHQPDPLSDGHRSLRPAGQASGTAHRPADRHPRPHPAHR